MKRLRLVGAVAAGLALGSMPWWRYAVHGVGGAPHVNHEPRHGGELAMAGDHHVELLRDAGRIEVHVSDAWRRPVRPRDAHAIADDATRVPLAWDRHRLVGRDDVGARVIETVVFLDDGTRVAVTFDAGVGPTDGGRAAR